MELKKLFMFGAVAATVLSACGEKDYYDPQYEPEKKKADYEANFIKKYGQIAANQDWDFSTSGWGYALSTRGTNGPETGEDGEAVEMTVAFRKNVKKAFPEQKCQVANLAEKGQGYTLISNGPFDIYPIYHGRCNEWTLLVNGKEIAPFSKINERMGFADNGTAEITNEQIEKLGDFTATGWRINEPIGTELYIQLKCTKSNGEYMYEGDIVSSVNFNIGEKDWRDRIITPSKYDPKVGVTINHSDAKENDHNNLTQGSLAITKDSPIWSELGEKNPFDVILLYEDAFHKNTDLDYNDFFLGIVGRKYPPVPQEIEQWEVVKEKQFSKRYMMEDLGSTDDFDFNDVVVDLTGSLKEYWIQWYDPNTGESGSKINEEKLPAYGGLNATIRHKGGILPFQVLVGGVSISGNEKISPNMDADDAVREDKYDIEAYKITDEASYNAADAVITKNDIKLVVYGQTSGEVVTKEISFPKPGKVPCIIATDIDKKWSNERVALPWLEWK